MAKAKELSTAEKLKQLYELQSIDSELDQIRNCRSRYANPKSESGTKELESEMIKQKGNIKDSEALIERYKKQLDNVKNNREFDALNKEIEIQTLDIQLAEKRIRETQRNIELKKETLDASRKRLEGKQKELESKKVELAKIIEKTEKEEDKLRRKSDKARKIVEERLLKSYDKIRNSYRNGLAVVTVLRNSCGGCFNQIPPQMQLEIGLHKKIVVCEHCGRILVDESIMEVEMHDA